jgi:hypothetical protein
MTEAEQFAKCDAYQGNTMLVFSDRAIAARYVAHRAAQGHVGVIAQVEDTRGGTGLVVLWRDPVEPGRLEERMRNCLWLLEETLAGRSAWPQPGEVGELWTGGFSRPPAEPSGAQA